MIYCRSTAKNPPLLFFLASGVYCPPIPHVKFAKPNTTSNLVDTVVAFTCFLGYLFELPSGGKVRQRTTHCSVNITGETDWSVVIDHCEGGEKISNIPENHPCLLKILIYYFANINWHSKCINISYTSVCVLSWWWNIQVVGIRITVFA